MSGSADRFSGLARFAHRIGRLKSTPRAGWLHRGVPPEQTESVADHSFRVAVLAWLASAEIESLDRDRVIRLALLHDLAESITGDITPYDPVVIEQLNPAAQRRALNQRQDISPERKAAKHAAETAAIADLIAGLSPAQRQELDSLWTELLGRATPEAKFVKEIDLLETYLQSREYLSNDSDLPMGSFASEVATTIQSAEMVELRDAITVLHLEPPDDAAGPGNSGVVGWEDAINGETT